MTRNEFKELMRTYFPAQRDLVIRRENRKSFIAIAAAVTLYAVAGVYAVNAERSKPTTQIPAAEPARPLSPIKGTDGNTYQCVVPQSAPGG
jgi:hypothetical protein